MILTTSHMHTSDMSRPESWTLWMIADMGSYINKLGICQGKNELVTDGNKNFSLGGHIVLNIYDHYIEQIHELSFDRYFTSYSLL